jgi:hypothetical protein
VFGDNFLLCRKDQTAEDRSSRDNFSKFIIIREKNGRGIKNNDNDLLIDFGR